MTRRPAMNVLSLRGLHAAPSQRFGAIRITPLLRDRPQHDLRLGLRRYAQDVSVVALDRNADDLQEEGGLAYLSYIPHAVVARFTSDGSEAAALGGQLLKSGDRRHAPDSFRVRFHHRMAKKEAPDLVRFLPLHLAMEHFLALCFGGPDHAWPEYSRRALRDGLSPRSESSYAGRAVSGLPDALRMFEIHDGQVGVALFVADALASLFVAAHPDDYRAMHRSLLDDFYGELIVQYAAQIDRAMDVTTALDAARVTDLASLRAELDRARRTWAEAHELLLADVLGRPLDGDIVRTLGPFTLQRFVTNLDLDGENHIGEAILRDDGEVMYLKTYRLSKAQTKRAFLLRTLSAHEWRLNDAARELRCTRAQLIERLIRADFGWLLKPDVRAEAGHLDGRPQSH